MGKLLLSMPFKYVVSVRLVYFCIASLQPLTSVFAFFNNSGVHFPYLGVNLFLLLIFVLPFRITNLLFVE